MTDYFDFSDDFWNEEEEQQDLNNNLGNEDLTEEEILLNKEFEIEMYNAKYGVL